MKFVLVGFFVCLTIQMSHAQGSDSDLKSKFSDLVSNEHQEKVFSHTDRSTYVTGETMWISAYCVDASTNQLTTLSKVVNFELINDQGKSLVKERAKLENGRSSGQLFISPELPSGHYTLRAYTNWMKNFDADLAFMKKISVINPADDFSTKNLPTTDSTLLVNFFPEGGSLVEGLRSKVAVKVSDKYGLGTGVTGIVYDNNEIEVGKFKTTRRGFTSFWLEPQTGKKYFARIAIGNKVETFDLPQAQTSGVSLIVERDKEDNYIVKVEAYQKNDDRYFLVIHSKGELIDISSFNPLNPTQRKILLTELKDGISHIAVLNKNYQPVAERIVFKFPEENKLISGSTQSKEYSQREKVIIDLEGEQIVNASISVHKSGNSSLENTETIISSLLISSDLKGHIYDPEYYFNPKVSSRRNEMDLLMMTHGWRRFKWEDIASDRERKYKYPAEINAPLLSGQYRPDGPISIYSSLFVNLPGRTSILNALDVSLNGTFHFEVPFRIENEFALFFSLKDSLKSSNVNIYSPFDLNYNPRHYRPGFNASEKSFLESLNGNIQLSQVYRQFNNVNGIAPDYEKVNTHFYGTPDFQYILDDFTRFETVKDLFIEYIRSAVIRDNNRKKGFFVLNDGFLESHAMTTIDGVPILDFEYILNFDPLKIEKIGVINDYYYMGNARFSGILNFTTYDGDYDQQELPEYLVEKVYHGLQRPREFYSPDYTVNKEELKRIPDYRNTLYWNPDLNISANASVELEFHTSDDLGDYKIEVNGITESGTPVYFSESFKVRQKLP
ncbi:MAG: hypothetical protein JXQ96_08935 [Cyclobacteriaceae bacterium]